MHISVADTKELIQVLYTVFAERVSYNIKTNAIEGLYL